MLPPHGQWQQSHRKPADLFSGDLEKFELTETTGYSACVYGDQTDFPLLEIKAIDCVI
jgi:hypothetical protein